MNAPKKTPTRRYHLKSKDELSRDERIIVATNPAQALSHAAKTAWDIEVLTMDNAIRLTKEGVVDEVAGDTNQLSLDV